MPNSRRRKFSVQNDVARKNLSKGNSIITNSIATINPPQKNNKTPPKSFQNRSVALEPMAVVFECDDCSPVRKENRGNPVEANTIKLNSLSTSTTTVSQETNASISQITTPLKRETITRNRREPTRQPRARVRSPKHSLAVFDTPHTEIYNSVELSSMKQHFKTVIDSAPESSSNPTSQTPHSSKQETKDRTRQRHQHRARVRSPKHSLYVFSSPSIEIRKVEDMATSVDVSISSCKETVGTNVIDWEHEAHQDWAQDSQVYTMDVAELDMLELEQQSDHSLDDMCRICHSGDCLSPELGRLVSACNCRGTVGRVHVRCLERWLTESGKSRCELCGTRYHTRRVHRYGVLKALVMWFLSQNAKQLMVDSLGIMLMSPLAVLAAWLSGRTLAGLMTQESQVTPWPLASTFVLACMTLVCYYCWIVSAATRHALGWWIWYRSQYEVRLELQDEE
ncbi:E3 ubiquitin-protein ligase MARCHF7-like [Leguminivora glycinivorella]|uniref:E3 ubiquitin-protein ligase MARCHF7-like n=1 Tax=Leguminivora glycinivorella TaxID=1035111 RepID=UPI00200C0E48|nr:E3 ubiquitin-protein ligase MARCHF7-like [Leguminivora glycinivorella]